MKKIGFLSFGHWTPSPHSQARSASDVLLQSIDLAVAAEEVGAVGAAITVWPFIDTLEPARDTLALATTEVDLSPVQVGQRLTVPWRGKPVFIDHRTPQEIQAAQNVNVSELRDPQPDSARV